MLAVLAVLICAQADVADAGEPAGDIADLDLDALLSQDLRTQEVTVASRTVETVGDAPATITVISGDDFVRHDWRNVAEALRSVPGLYVSNGRDRYATGVRGLSFPNDVDSRVLVLLDGHTLNNPWNAASHTGELMTVPPDAIERVEVIRGPASSVYGSNAFFAVVNIVTKKPTDAAPLRLSADVLASSLSLYRASLSGHARTPFGLDVSGFAQVLGGNGPSVLYEDQTRPRLNLGVRTPSSGITRGTDYERGAAGGLGLSFKGLQVTAQLHQRFKGLPGAPGDSIFGDPFNATADLHGFVEASYRLQLGAHAVSARAWYDNFQHRRTLHLDPSDWEPAAWAHGDPRVVSEGRAETLGGELQGTFQLHARDSLVVGVELTRVVIRQPTYELDPRTGMADPTTVTGGITDANGDMPPIVPLNVGAYVQNSLKPHDRLNLVAGLRYDYNTVFFRSESPLSALAPRAAAVFKATDDLTLKLGYAEAFRYPTVFEAFFDDQTSVCGSTRVRPERQRTAELSAVYNVARAYNLSASLYAMQVQGLLVRQAVDSCYVGSGPRLQFVNAAEVLVLGGEASLDVRAQNVTAFVSFGANHAAQTLAGVTGRPANSPTLVAGAGAAVPILPENRLTASARAHFVSGRLTSALAPALGVPAALRVEGSLTSRRLWRGLGFGVTGVLQVKLGSDQPGFHESVPRDPVTGAESVASAVPQNAVELRGHVTYAF